MPYLQKLKDIVRNTLNEIYEIFIKDTIEDDANIDSDLALSVNEPNTMESETIYTLDNCTDTLGFVSHRYYYLNEESPLYGDKRVGKTDSIVLIDIDDFRDINNRYGHEIDDEILIVLSSILKKELKKDAIVMRVGGEEFLIYMQDTNIEDAVIIAEKIRLKVEKSSFHLNDSNEIKFTISAGVALAQEDSHSSFTEADKALYRAKESGKNIVSVGDNKNSNISSYLYLSVDKPIAGLESTLEQINQEYIQTGATIEEVYNIAYKVPQTRYLVKLYGKSIECASEADIPEAIRTCGTDPLTGLSNRRHYNDILEKDTRVDKNDSIVLIDIDWLKDINSSYGYIVGDEIIILLSTILKKEQRSNDTVVRFMGEEFIIHMQDTEIEDAVMITEKIRIEVENTSFYTEDNERLKFTISAGVAHAKKDLESSIAKADGALYHAKMSGKNIVYVESEEVANKDFYIAIDKTKAKLKLTHKEIIEKFDATIEPIYIGMGHVDAGLRVRLNNTVIASSDFQEAVEICSRNELTGLTSRGYYHALFKDNIIGKNDSIVILDIDNFRRINDTYGYAVGDEIIILLSSILKKEQRSNDTVVRYSRNDFLIHMQDTEIEDSVIITEKIRTEVENTSVDIGYTDKIKFTISAGVAQAKEDLNSSIREADMALYRAKESGRNIVSVNSELLYFYENRVNKSGRTLSEILEWDDKKLEQTHDYIQWIFPLKVASQYNDDAPLLSESDMEYFQNSFYLQEKVMEVFKLMLNFYGFEIKQDKICKSDVFKTKSLNWLTPRNHNFLRISRILQSLVLLGHSNYANMFFEVLEDVYVDHSDIIGDSFVYWKNSL